MPTPTLQTLVNEGRLQDPAQLPANVLELLAEAGLHQPAADRQGPGLRCAAESASCGREEPAPFEVPAGGSACAAACA
jgi:hypothetical protein